MEPFAAEVARCRAVQQAWAARPVRDRLRPVRELRHLLVERADALAAAVQADVRRNPDEVVATDLVPTAAAAKFLLTDAARILKPRRIGWRPLWLLGCRDTVHRRPWGVVGLIGTWNYPIFLTAVPLLQALAAGNGVLWKPSEHTPKTADALAALLRDAGFPADLLIRLPGDREAGPQLAEANIDFVHFTGSDATGRKLAARLGERLIPSALELSGVDAMIVRHDADVELAARSAWYGATLNAGQTCLATRRVYVDRQVWQPFRTVLSELVRATPEARLVTRAQAEQANRLLDDGSGAALSDIEFGTRQRSAAGDVREVVPAAIFTESADLAICREASFAPLLAVVPVADDDAAVSLHNDCPFGLAAVVFTRDTAAAEKLAARLLVGTVVVNDVIAPTAHPATPFGGRGASGWGVTQGEDGLLQMTVSQPVTVRRGRFRPHVDAHLANDSAAGDVARGILRFTHGRTVGERLRGLRQMISGMTRTGKKPG